MIPDIRHIRNVVEYRGKIYFMTASHFNLFEINPDNDGEVSSICSFPWKKNKGEVDGYIYNEILVFAAMGGNQIGIYDLKSGKKFYYMYENGKREEGVCSYIYDDVLWVFPRNIQGEMIGFALKERTFKVSMVWNLFSEKHNRNGRFFYGTATKDIVVMNITGTNHLVRFDFPSMTVDEISVPIEENIFAINFIEGRLWITADCGRKLYVMDEKLKAIEEIYAAEEKGKFFRPMKYRDGILLFDERGVAFLKDGSISRVCLDESIKGFNSWFYCSKVMKGKYYLFPWTADHMLVMNGDGFENIRYIRLRYPRNIIYRNTDLVKEGYIEITDFIEAIQTQNVREGKERNDSAGKKIFCFLSGT